jgi:hypothetical protein
MRRVVIVIAVLVAILAAAVAAVALVGPDSIGMALERRLHSAQEQKERASAERKAEAKFTALPVSPCADFGKGSGPQLCIELASAETVPLGSPVELRLRWRNLAAGQQIRLRVTSAAPVGTRYAYSGPQGAITSETFAGTPNGEQLIRWDGKSVYCAPADAPMMCDSGDVGRFRIEALLYTGDDPFWPSWPPMHPVPTHYLLRSEAPEVEFTGPPAITRGSRYGGPGLNRALIEAIPADLAGNGFLSWNLPAQNPPVYETLFSYCSDYRVPEPLEGHISLCISKSARDRYGVKVGRDDISISKHVRMASSFIPAKDAKAIAERAAAAFLKGTILFDHYPTDAELKRFGPQPGDRADWYSNMQEAAQKAWESRIVYLQQNQTLADYVGKGAWLVSVDQVAADLGQQRHGDFITYYYRIGSDRRPCLVAKWNRDQDSGKRPRLEDAASLPCL